MARKRRVLITRRTSRNGFLFYIRSELNNASVKVLGVRVTRPLNIRNLYLSTLYSVAGIIIHAANNILLMSRRRRA